MAEPIDHEYFNWLYAKVCDVRVHSPSLTFNNLLAELHRIEFVWLLSGDDNRAEDGRDLRIEFIREAGWDLDVYDPWLHEPTSVLEVLVSFSRIAAFNTGDTPRFWFERMLYNLDLLDLNDGVHFRKGQVRRVIDRFMWRKYDFNGGGGGLFPLLRSRQDQREVEIWYQFNAYVLENDMV